MVATLVERHSRYVILACKSWTMQHRHGKQLHSTDSLIPIDSIHRASGPKYRQRNPRRLRLHG